MTAVTTLYAHQMPLYVEACELIVKDLEKVSAYYQDCIGLKLLDKTDNRCVLGVAGHALLYLTQKEGVKLSSRHDAGLFHIAFLLPERKDLAQYLRYAEENNIYISGASDHFVSEALYLNDPEGNGIEIYVDREPSRWPRDSDGFVMDTIPLDRKSLIAQDDGSPWLGMPDNARIGHVHLQVSDLESARGFYCDLLGMQIQETYPGALFMSAGEYHHHIAANIWNSRGAGVRSADITGLKRVVLNANSSDIIQKIQRSLEHSQVPQEAYNDMLTISDPWGIEIQVC